MFQASFGITQCRIAADNAARLIRVLASECISKTLLLLLLLLLLLSNPTACHTVQDTEQNTIQITTKQAGSHLTPQCPHRC
jgi:hypothetical protein